MQKSKVEVSDNLVERGPMPFTLTLILRPPEPNTDTPRCPICGAANSSKGGLCHAWN